MCGQELSPSAYSHRYGALAVMSPSPLPSPASSPPLSPASSPRLAPEQAMGSFGGSISFYNEDDRSCQVATHVRFSPSGPLPACPLRLVIGSFGDVGRIDLDPSAQVASEQPMRLLRPLHLHVGDDKDGNPGIIGHRATLYCEGMCAEGIVGYNSLPQSSI